MALLKFNQYDSKTKQSIERQYRECYKFTFKKIT